MSNKAFWDLVIPFPSNKGVLVGTDVSLVKDDNIVTDDQLKSSKGTSRSLGPFFDKALSVFITDYHRGISLNIRRYYLVFLDIVIFNIFIISRCCCLSCFRRAANTLINAKESRKCEGSEGEKSGFKSTLLKGNPP